MIYIYTHTHTYYIIYMIPHTCMSVYINIHSHVCGITRIDIYARYLAGPARKGGHFSLPQSVEEQVGCHASDVMLAEKAASILYIHIYIII